MWSDIWSDECRLCHSGNCRGAPHTSPAICHIHWGHLRRTAGAGNMGKVQENFFFFSLGGVFVSLYCGHVFARTPFFLIVRFYAQRHGLNGDSDRKWSEENLKRTKGKGKEHRVPSAGWGSSLCCWSGCHITPYGDDCAIYCLAGAGDLRQKSQTGSTWMTELNVLFVNKIYWMETNTPSFFMFKENVVRKWRKGVNWDSYVNMRQSWIIFSLFGIKWF